MQDWQRAQAAKNSGTVSMHQRKWCKPPPGWIKINMDAACRGDAEFIGAGCIVRDENGHFLRARTGRVQGCMQAREAEAVSFKEALTWIKSSRTYRCIFEMDAKTVVDAIHGPQKYSNFHTIILECIELLKHFEEVLVCFDHRSANKVAHVLAQAAYSMPDFMEWCNAVPEFICNLITEES